MRLLAKIALLSALLLGAGAAQAKEHVVADGQTWGKIAKRYQISIAALCKANGMSRRDKIRVGQRLTIPASDEDAETIASAPKEAPEEDKSEPEPRKEEPRKEREDPDDRSLGGGLRQIDLPGAAPAYYFEPQGKGRLGLKPVLVYLHGRGGHPEADCRRWARVARGYGWLVCPSGPVPYGAPSHREFIEHNTPQEYRAPGADIGALIAWLTAKASKK